MPSFVGPLDNRGELLADSRRNRWYDEKPGGSWTVQGGPGGGERRKGEGREKEEREGSREKRARAGGRFAASRGAESAPRCDEFLLQFVKILKLKKSWCGGGVERKELNWGGFWEDSMGLGSEEVEEDMSAASGGGRKRGSADFELLSSSLEVFLQSFQALGLKEESVSFVLIFGL